MKSFAILSYVFHGVFCGFLNCPENPTACTGIDCGNFASDRRAGYACSVWPFYAGGFSKREFEKEYYLCLEWSVSYAKADAESNITISHAWCRQWTTTEISEDSDEIEFGTCYCTQNNDRFCTAWACSQTEYGFGGDEDEYECGRLSNGLPRYCYLECDDKSCWEVEAVVDIEATWCSCNASTNYRYCDNWYCEEQSTLDNGDTIVEQEYYTCLPAGNQPNTSIVDGKYYNDICWKWSGSVDSIKEFEVAECVCKQPFIGYDNSFCTTWTCTEMGVHKRHNQKWSHFPLALILWCIFGGCFFFVVVVVYEVYETPLLLACGCCVWFVVIGFAAIAHGGFACFVFFVGSLVCTCVGILVHCCTKC